MGKTFPNMGKTFMRIKADPFDHDEISHMEIQALLEIRRLTLRRNQSQGASG